LKAFRITASWSSTLPTATAAAADDNDDDDDDDERAPPPVELSVLPKGPWSNAEKADDGDDGDDDAGSGRWRKVQFALSAAIS